MRVEDFDGHPYDATQRRVHEPFPADNCKPVVISDDVWIGAGVVVTTDVAADVVVAGNPARVVKHLEVSEQS